MDAAQGYQHGVAETLAKVDDQVAKQARVAFADYAREEERARAVLVERNIAKLSEVQYRCGVAPAHESLAFNLDIAIILRHTVCIYFLLCACRPPQHAPECVAEEAAVLVLDPRVHSKEHSNAITAYAHCANAVQSRLMNPAAAAMR